MFVQAYLHTAINLLEAYRGIEPFSAFLKKYFSLHKKFGSKDRKHIAHLCYCYFRLGKSLKGIALTDRLAVGLLLCNDYAHPVLGQLQPEWSIYGVKAMQDKLALVSKAFPFELKEIFSMENNVSSEINFEELCISMLHQPYTYVRTRPGKENAVLDKLKEANIIHEFVDNSTIQLSPAVKIDTVLAINDDVVVQDASSQKVFDSLLANKGREFHEAWDCCAASGGKSILLKDLFPQTALTVSDIRESIIINLQKRFAAAGIPSYKSFIADLSSSQFKIDKQFDLVICDAPCTGSGTWARTPEQLFFFDQKKIKHYSDLQKKIMSNCIKGLKAGGTLLYITCSVFKEENEDMVAYAKNELLLHLIDERYIKGYNRKADTLFTALFQL